MARVFAFIRTSPKTQNTGIHQGMYITTSCLHLRDNGVIPYFNSIRPFLCKEVDRRSVLDSVGFQMLVDAIRKTDANDSVYVVASSIIRIGYKYEDILSVMSHLVGERKNIELLFLDSFGINHNDHAHEVTKYSSSLDKLSCKHVDAGKSINVPKKFESEREMYFDNAKELYDQWIMTDSIPMNIQDAVTRGKNLSMRIISIRKWLGDALSAMRNNPNICVKQLVATYPYKPKGQPHRGVAIYTRTSPSTCSTKVNVSDLPAYQLSRCVSFYLHSGGFKEQELSIMNDKWKGREFINEGFANLVARILDREVSDVIINTTNRVSSSTNKIIFFHEICRVNKVSLHYVSHIGMNIMDVIALDCKRLEQREAALRQFQGSISDKVERMEQTNREHHLAIQKIRIMCRSAMMKDNLCVDDDDNVEQNTIYEIEDDNDD
jgi:hypothetical protein